jgi:hypothetical protein
MGYKLGIIKMGRKSVARDEHASLLHRRTSDEERFIKIFQQSLPEVKNIPEMKKMWRDRIEVNILIS